MNTESHLAFDHFRVDCAGRRLLMGEKSLPLTGKVFELLLIFATSNGAALSRETLYDHLWPNTIVEEANLSQTIYLLRRALDPGGDGRAYIETIPRFGYRFVKEVREAKAPPAVAKWSPPARRSIHRVQTAFAIVAAVLLLLWPGQARVSPLSVEAHDAYALGQYHLSLRTPSDLSYALGYFHDLQRDAPDNALGYAAAASAEALLGEFQTDNSPAQRRYVEHAERYRDAAFARDPRNSEALAVAGFIAYRFRNDRAAAERDLESALTEDPQNAAAHHWRGVVYLIHGRIAAAIGEFENAHRLQPTSEVFSRWLACGYAYGHQPEAAIALATQTVQIERDDAPAWLAIACAQEQRGDLHQALQTLRDLGRIDPYERPYLIPDEARLETRLQPQTQRRLTAKIARLAATGRLDPFETALFFLTVGKRASALRLLHDAKRSPFLVSIQAYDPRLNSLI